MKDLKAKFKKDVLLLHGIMQLNKQALNEIPLKNFEKIKEQLIMFQEANIRYSEARRLYKKFIR